MACACRTRFPLLWRDGYDGYPLRVSFASAPVSFQLSFHARVSRLLSRILRHTSARTATPSHVVDEEGRARLFLISKRSNAPLRVPSNAPLLAWTGPPKARRGAVTVRCYGSRLGRGEASYQAVGCVRGGGVARGRRGRRSKHGGTGSLPDVAGDRGRRVNQRKM